MYVFKKSLCESDFSSYLSNVIICKEVWKKFKFEWESNVIEVKDYRVYNLFCGV